jgi:hypothetical protein
MEIDKNIFGRIKKEAENNYRKIGSIYCPYLKDDVSFNNKGLDHIKLKEWDKARLLSDQYLRLKFLKLVPLIIKDSHTLQEYSEQRRLERQKINSRWEKRLVTVRYYGFVAIVKEIKIKVIVKEIEGGKPFFWSVIPFWKREKDPLLRQTKKVFCDGDLENQ